MKGLNLMTTGRQRQRGMSAMITGLLILVLMSVMSIFAVNVGIFEQRTSSNELRARQAFTSAEAGISALLEYMQAYQTDLAESEEDTGWFKAGNVRWTECNGAPAEGDPCWYVWDEDAGAWQDYGLGAQIAAGNPVFKYEFGGTNFIPVPMNLATGATYNTTALLCIYDPEDNICMDQGGAANNLTLQLISLGASDDAIGDSAVSVLVAPFRPVNTAVDAPLVAASTFAGNGTFNLVANPNGGGPGVPVSVWSGADIVLSSNDNARSCHLQEYFDEGTDIREEGGTQICHDCSCPSADEKLLTGSVSDGIDIVDVDGDQGPTPDASNFPSDVFKYTLGFSECDWESVYNLAADSGTVVGSCDELVGDEAGLIWVEGDCQANGDIGSVRAPVLLVLGGGHLHVSGGANIYGMLFATTVQIEDDANGAAPVCPRPDIASRPDLDISLTGGTKVFGAVISDKDIDLGAGTLDVVYNEEVLTNLRKFINYAAWGQLPGTWTDFVDN